MTAEDLRKSILQQAIQGKLVPQNPTDEPASALLARIREEKQRLVKEKKIKKDKNESIIYRGEDNSYYEKFTDGTVKCIDEEISFDIPAKWCWCRIGNLFLHASGKQQSSNNKSKGTPQKFITTSNLYWGYFNLENVKVMNFTDEEILTCSATKGDLLVCEGGAGYGRSAIWDKDFDICLQNHVHRLRPVVSGVCEYVYYFIYLLKQSNQLLSVGTAMPGLSANRLKSIIIPVPPIEEQTRIVSRIDHLMKIIERFEQSIMKLDELEDELRPLLKKSILQYAIQGKLVPQNPSDEPASILLDSIRKEKEQLLKTGRLKKKDITDSIIFKGEDNKYFEKIGNDIICIDEELPFEIPDTWTWVRFKNLVSFSLGKTPDRAMPSYWQPAEVPWISIADIEDKSVLLTTKEKISTKALDDKFGGITSPAGTLIMSFKLTIGKVAILGIDAVHNEAIISISPYVNEDNIVRDYLYTFLALITGYTATTEAIKGATLNSKKIAEMLVPLPPLAEQRRIVSAVNTALTSIMSR